MTGRARLAGEIAARAGAAAAAALTDAVRSTRLYRMSLRGPMPDAIAVNPQELRTASPELGQRLIDGHFALAGARLEATNVSPFILDMPSRAFAEELHGFGWLRHVAAANDPEKSAAAQRLVESWLEECGAWNSIGWQPHVTAGRLISWTAHGQMLLDGADLVYRSWLLRSMAAQARHLARTAPKAPKGAPRLTAAIGLAMSGIALTEGRTRLRKGLALLARELDRQILPDGGHLTRSPAIQLDLLADLVALRDVLMARDVEAPASLRNALDRMMPMLRFFRHGDGRLALFNGAGEGAPGAVDAVLAHDDARGRPFGFAPHSGFQRLAAGRTLVIADSGAPPPGPLSQEAHAGCLSFEMSAGRHRLVVNCGTATARGPEWEDATRATAAHSVLTIEDTSSARILRTPWLRRLMGPRIVEGPRHVQSRRTEEDRGVWIDMLHDGYVAPFGLEHERRMYLSKDGDDLRGEDTLIRVRPPAPPWWDPFRFFSHPEPEEDFTIRFHLHPDVRVSLAQDGSHVLALLPNGDGWQVRAGSNAELALEESIYLGTGSPRRTRQITVSHHVFRGEAHVKWSFRRLTTRNLGTEAPTQEDAFAEDETAENEDASGTDTSPAPGA